MAVMDEISILPIGVVRSKVDEPREDHWAEIKAEIILDSSRFTEESLKGLEEFSHVEVIFQFHQIADKDPVFGTRHPRGNTDWPQVGIFAQRGKDRPNHMGSTICKVMGRDGFALRVKGLDAYDGSPVLDLKPVMREFVPERNEINQPEWAEQLMKKYF
jgi:tRNA-Thr(GGU) m(6)t(6)A37 methyltransferase TsaA